MDPTMRVYGVRPSVSAWGCQLCARVFRKEKQADACCRCATCKTKTKGVEPILRQECAACLFERLIECRRGEVLQATEQLAQAEEALKKTLAKKRPAKGTPWR